MAVTLRDLRQLVGIKTGDLLILEATAASADGSSFRDQARLAERGDQAPSIVGKLLYLSEGTAQNLQHEARVTAFASATTSLTIAPAAPLPPQEGDVGELWSVAERIGTIQHIHKLINHAIEAVRDLAGPEVYADAQTFRARTGYLTIPATWASFGGAEWADLVGFRRDIREAHLQVRTGLSQVWISAAGSARGNNRSVYLYGYERCLPLVAETDATPVNSEWIVESVAESLTLGRSWASADPAAAERRANFWSSKAALYRRDIAAPRRGLNLALP